jgi:predicted RNase H-like HicB family nuclease
MNPKDLEFRITKEDDGSLAASCINEDIFTQGSDLEGLKTSLEDAIKVHFSDSGVKEFRVHLDIIESGQQIPVAA